jgi:hypothetical protein
MLHDLMILCVWRLHFETILFLETRLFEPFLQKSFVREKFDWKIDKRI